VPTHSWAHGCASACSSDIGSFGVFDVALPGGGQLVAHGKFRLCLNGRVGAFTVAAI
jgi:hypothetical protein